MAKFNKELAVRNVAVVERGKHDAMNRAGGLAFQDSPQMALYKQVATSLWSGDSYYEKKEEWFKRFQSNVVTVQDLDVKFPFALAAYARDKSGLALRTSPLALYVEASTNKAAKGTGLIRKYAPKVLLRADEPAEAIAYFKKYHKGVIPHGLLRGIADTLPSYDEYALGKYKNTGAVSLRDVFRLARPKPKTDDQKVLWNRAVSGTLETPYTWEVELSKAQGDKEKQAVWNKLIKSRKLGLFALIRNVRNILKVGADIESALDQITQERVVGSGILPFQWYKAYKAIAEAGHQAISEVMQQAVEWSLADVSKLPGTTLVACDNSGSMTNGSSTRGMSNAEIGNLMGAMALYCCEEGIAGTFGESFAIARTNPEHRLFHNKAEIDRCGHTTGHSTDAWKVIEALIRDHIDVDRVILFSDMQCYDSASRYGMAFRGGHSLSGELEAYRQINPNVCLYSINLASQDNTAQFSPDQPVVELAGWSESIFQFIASMEAGESILTHISERY